MTGTNCDLFTHKSSRSYLNHLVHPLGTYCPRAELRVDRANFKEYPRHTDVRNNVTESRMKGPKRKCIKHKHLQDKGHP
jgi:hypothetical protein